LLISAVAFVFLACVPDITPDNPDLQPPLVNIGLRFEEFLEWLNIWPKDQVPMPWITYPPTVTHWADPRLPEIRGWALNAQDRPSLNPSGEPPTVTVVQLASSQDTRALRVLGTASVGEDRNWKIEDVPIDLPVMHVAATVRLGTTTSGYSNIVSIYRQEEALRPQIVSPRDGERIVLWDVWERAVKGTGPAGEQIKLLRNGKEVGRARVRRNGEWVVNDVVLAEGDNELVAVIEAINVQSSPVKVSFDPPRWPFKCERDVTNHFSKEGHPGIDIDVPGNDTPVHPIADGSVSRGSDHFVKLRDRRCKKDPTADGAYYVIVDHGPWISIYLHLREDGRPSSGKAYRDSIIGYADTTGCAFGSHLHLEVRLKPEGKMGNPWSLEPVNIDPSQFYWRYWPSKDCES